MTSYKLPKGSKQRFIECGVKLVKAKTTQQAKQIGIHLLCPTKRELGDALETAIRDCYPTVIVHDFGTWGYHRGFQKRAEPKPRLHLAMSTEFPLCNPLRADLHLIEGGAA